MLYYNHSKDKNTKTKEILKMNVQEIAKELRGPRRMEHGAFRITL